MNKEYIKEVLEDCTGYNVESGRFMSLRYGGESSRFPALYQARAGEIIALLSVSVTGKDTNVTITQNGHSFQLIDNVSSMQGLLFAICDKVEVKGITGGQALIYIASLK